jgi:FKBP-type peptidyl-prolyl cis-trans isomerase 2
MNHKELRMSQAKQGDTVRVHYTGTLEDGVVFDSSKGREPLEFVVGAGQVIPGFEKAVEGLAPEETRTVTLPPEEAYGERDDARVLTIERERIPSEIEIEVGTTLQMQTPEGQALPVTVKEIEDESVTLDANHPLAGKALTFEVELVEVK